MSQFVELSIIGHGTKYKWIICENDSKHLILLVIWSHCMNFINRFWVNILKFWNAKNFHHSPYHMIMDSLYLLKCLVE
jgi:hypothetical protein